MPHQHILLLLAFTISLPAWSQSPCRRTFGPLTAPAGERITFEQNKPIVPAHPIIPFIKGEGIGPEVTASTQQVIDAAVALAYGSQRQISWFEVPVAEDAILQFNNPLPQETLDALKYFGVSIKGPLGTPTGGGHASYNVALRKELCTFSCVRPIRHFPNVPTPYLWSDQVNMVVFRENTEDVYSGIGFFPGDALTQELITNINQIMAKDERLKHRAPIDLSSAIGIKTASEQATKRHMRQAIQYALQHGYQRITIMHKGNIQKEAEGSFKEWSEEVAFQEFPNLFVTPDQLSREDNWQIPEGKILLQSVIADNMFQQAMLKPSEHQIIVAPNSNGDLISDMLAAMVGSLGVAPGANIGDGVALFEATHGTAPDIAGKNLANPASLILSGVMMLDYMGWHEARDIILNGISQTYRDGIVTGDLRSENARQVLGTKEWTNYLLKVMGQESHQSAATEN